MKREVGDWVTLVLVCAIGAGLGTFQRDVSEHGKIDAPSTVGQFAVLPWADALSNGVRATLDWSRGVFRANKLTEENRRLFQENASLSADKSTHEALRRENESLRQLLQMPDYPNKQKVAAQVVGYYPDDDRLTINVGESQGIRPGMPVVAPRGLVGLVQAVSSGSSQVLLIWSPPPLRIGALVQSETPQAGLLTGERPQLMRLEFFHTIGSEGALDIERPVANTGDSVVTSGFSENIPGGIPIGQVSEVKVEEAYGRTTAFVRPYINLATVREVVVLR